MSARPGFTLVELLVAISILAMVAVLGWRGLDGIVRARVALTEQMETTRGMQLAFAQLQSDCEHIANAEILGQRPFLLTDKDRLLLVRTVFTENEPSRLQVVSYRVVGTSLMRSESIGTRDLNQLDTLWQAVLTNADTTRPVMLQQGVVSMRLLTWQNGVWHQVGGRIDTPGAQQRQASVVLPPTGLQVDLQVQGLATPMSKSFLLGL